MRSASECVRRSHSDADQTLKAPVWRSGRLKSHHHTRHYKTVLSVLCLTWRCELDNCYQRVQTSYFPSATVLSCRESNSHHRSGQYTTPTRQLCRVWRGGVNGPGSQSWRGRVPRAPQCGCAYDIGRGGGDAIIHLIRRCELIPLDVPSLVRRPISYSFMRRSGKVCSVHRTLWRQRLGPLIAAQDNYRSSPICSCQLRTLQVQMYRPYRPGDYITATHTDASRMLSTKELPVCV